MTGTAAELSAFIRIPAASTGASAAGAAEIFEHFRVEDGRTDLVYTHCPLAKVDLAAAVTAEWEVLVFKADQRFAGRAMEELCGFFLLRHGVLSCAAAAVKK